MKFRMIVLSAALALFAPGVAAAAEQDPFAGKSLDEIKRIIQARMEDRKKDGEFLSEYEKFRSREEKQGERRGKSLAAAMKRGIGEYTQAEYHFRFGQYKESEAILSAYLAKNAKTRRIQGWALFMLYRLLAANYAWMGESGKATIALGQSSQHNDVGGPFKRIQKLIADFPSLQTQLMDLKKRRDYNPRSGDLQWTLCEFYASKIFLPLEESIELAWMEKSFPDHPKVKGGDSAWAMLKAQEKLGDWSAALSLATSFKRDFQNHFAYTLGDASWSLAKAQFGMGKFKDAIKTAEQMKIEFPKNHHVESKTVDAFITECDNASKSKTPPPDTGNQWNQWWDF